MRFAVSAFLIMSTTAFMISGCSKSNTPTGDAGIQFDASRPDATPDASIPDAMLGPSEGMIGAPCTDDSQCEGGICIPDREGFRDGYCSQTCGRGDGCPDGSSCVQVSRGLSLCLDNCNPDGPRECRQGYGCADSFRIPQPVCLPGCTDDTDCEDGLVCNPEGGFTGSGQCYDADAGLGDACTTRDDCPERAFCLEEDESGWPAGACLGFGCDPASNSGCPDGAHCLPTERGGGLCVASCEDSSECRDAYECTSSSSYPDRRYCGPACTMDDQCSGGRVCYEGEGLCSDPFDAEELGAACSTTRGACEGGTCLREYESGYPGSYCIFLGCDPEAPDASDGCPGDGVCYEKDGTSYCLDGCRDAGDCRAGYACLPRDPSDPSGPSACTPACTDDMQCANRGFVCNPGTGLCTMSFAPETLGDACVTGEDCPGGRCVTEAESGWPSGSCTYPGCRLSGEGPSVTCPMGSVCVDDGDDNPAIGMCVLGCDIAAPSACRPGYSCGALADDGPNSCNPQCTSDDECDPSRTCDMMTGLCG